MPIHELLIIFKIAVYMCIACCVAGIISLIIEIVQRLTGHHDTGDDPFRWRDN